MELVPAAFRGDVLLEHSFERDTYFFCCRTTKLKVEITAMELMDAGISHYTLRNPDHVKAFLKSYLRIYLVPK